LDRQLDQIAASDDADERLKRQRARHEAAWKRFQQQHPRQADEVERRLGDAARVSREREAARSELTRHAWPGRAWALRAGELLSLGEDIFHLIAAEVLDLLEGKGAPVGTIPARKETYGRYRVLPPYPSIISGQFDPFAWAADPNRRSDIFDSHAPDLPPLRQPSPGQVRGVAGSAGIVEGLVRRIDCMEQSDQVRPGEILVTSQTNVGWTVLFPRLAAVVTDVGAPLSHAAVVARELGIPAVVGCGDATDRLKTGDRVRVDGTTGLVEILATT
jgi:pyruvate,water dikinase